MTTNPSCHTEFFVAGGTLPPNAPSYVKRPTDDELYHHVLRGEFAYVLTARQMGKSSLMTRTAQRLETEADVRTARIDLSSIGTQDDETWYRDLLENVARDLRLMVDLDQWWDENAHRGTLQRFHRFLADVVLQEISGPVVIFIDEIDYTIRLGKFSDDFFGAIRATYNNRAKEPAFNRLTFVLLGTASPTELIKDRTRTPFNIGQGIVLEDFSLADAQEVLLTGLEHHYPEQGESLLASVYEWTSGHPYLTQKICQKVSKSADERAEVTQIVDEIFLDDQSIKEANLKFVQDSLLAHPPRQQRRLLAIYRQVYQGKAIDDNPQSLPHNQLKLSGVVKTVYGQLEVRNQIYRQVFDLDWVQRHTKIDWNRIVARCAVAIAFLLLLALGYEYWATQEINASFGEYYQTTDPVRRAELLSKIVRVRRLFGATEHHDRVRDEFFELSRREEQMALFAQSTTANMEPNDLVALIQVIYVTLADVDKGNHSEPLLKQMVAILQPHTTEKCQRLQAEIEYWLAGRSHFQASRYGEALQAYNEALQRNDENHATMFERARVHAHLSQPEAALQDLDQLFGSLQQEPTPEPTENGVESTIEALYPTVLAVESSVSSGSTEDASPLQPLSMLALPMAVSPLATPVVQNNLPTVNRADPFLSNFRIVTQRIQAVRRLLQDFPKLNEHFSASSDNYPNLADYGLQLVGVQMVSETRVVAADGATYIRIPAGEFIMGSTDAEVDYAFELCQTYYKKPEDCQQYWYEDEQPQRTVYLDDFWIMKTEVTNAQYRHFIDAQGYLTTRYWSEVGTEWRVGNQITQPKCWDDERFNGPDLPVVCINWYEAEAYANWLSEESGLDFGLPTEAQWEKAARGVDGRLFPWGNSWDGTRVNYCDSNCTAYDWMDSDVDDGYELTAPVGSYPLGKSPYGALDMSGNVWEWTADWYDSDYYDIMEYTNPVGPLSGELRVLRGGSWNYTPNFMRAASRLRDNPDDENLNVGVRLRLASSPD